MKVSNLLALDTAGANLDNEPVRITLNRLKPHPQNPRVFERKDVIAQIKANLERDGFNKRHAIIVRPLSRDNTEFQIISGHHRVKAAKLAGLSYVWAWVNETISEEAAYLELLNSNAQSDLTPLEKGMHALDMVYAGKWGQSIAAYAEEVGRREQTVRREIHAARVARAVCDLKSTTSVDFREQSENKKSTTVVDSEGQGSDADAQGSKSTTVVDSESLCNHFSQLVEIHAAPEWLWPAMVEHAVSQDITKTATHDLVASLKNMEAPPDWMNGAEIAKRLVAGSLTIADVATIEEHKEKTRLAIEANQLNPEYYLDLLDQRLKEKPPARPLDILEIANAVLREQQSEMERLRQAEIEEEQGRDAAGETVASLRTGVSAEAWKALDERTQQMLLDTSRISIPTSFKAEKPEMFEWARFSWSPVTPDGEDITNPVLRLNALLAPSKTKIPAEAEKDARFKNVMVCPDTPLFGPITPKPWIEAIFKSVKKNPQWEFLFQTRFPKSVVEFEIPENAWIGMQVDRQSRVKVAEEAFPSLKGGVPWLLIEPMLEPLTFKRLDLFKWIVIAGASRSGQTPEWKPPFRWIADLVKQAEEAGTQVYFKNNLLGSRILELPFEAPTEKDPQKAPEICNYLKRAEVG